MGNFFEKFKQYRSIIVFDCETNGLDADKCQIIELAAIKVVINDNDEILIEEKMDMFIKQPIGEKLPHKIVELTGITDELLFNEGVEMKEAAKCFMELLHEPVLLVAHNAQFDVLFLHSLLKEYKLPKIDYLDSLTVYKDRRPYPHKLENAIISYGLQDRVQNSHRAIDDVIALWEVLKEMDLERSDLITYINLFGFNPKYGVSGRKIDGIRYVEQSFHNFMTNEYDALPMVVKRKGLH